MTKGWTEPTGQPKIEHYYKIYKFTISKGTINKATDLNGLSDGYCKIGQIKRDEDEKSVEWIQGLKTKVCKKTLTPIWDFSAMAMVSKYAQYIVLELWDDDLVKDDFIGKCKINVDEIKDNSTAQDYSVTDKHGNVSGSVTMLIQFQEDNNSNIEECVNL